MKDRMSIVTLEAGTRLIVKDESENIIPRKSREQMMNILQYTHSAEESMLWQCHKKIFWLGMMKQLKQKYEQCEKCQENKTSQATPHNEINSKDIFKNFLPGRRLEIDYA